MPSTCPNCSEEQTLYVPADAPDAPPTCSACLADGAFHGTAYDCEACGGCLMPLGLLGSTLHFRCERCAATSNVRLIPAT